MEHHMTVLPRSVERQQWRMKSKRRRVVASAGNVPKAKNLKIAAFNTPSKTYDALNLLSNLFRHKTTIRRVDCRQYVTPITPMPSHADAQNRIIRLLVAQNSPL